MKNVRRVLAWLLVFAMCVSYLGSDFGMLTALAADEDEIETPVEEIFEPAEEYFEDFEEPAEEFYSEDEALEPIDEDLELLEDLEAEEELEDGEEAEKAEDGPASYGPVDGAYVSILFTRETTEGKAKDPHVKEIKLKDYAAPEGTEILEGYEFSKTEDWDYALVTLTGMPDLAEGESLSIYTIEGGALSGWPMMGYLSAGDTAYLPLYAYEGFVLVKVLPEIPEPVLEEQTIDEIPAEGVNLSLSGLLPVGAQVLLSEPAAEMAPDGRWVSLEERLAQKGLAVLAYDFTILDENGNVFQPAEGSPITVTLTGEAIQDALDNEYELQVYHIPDTPEGAGWLAAPEQANLIYASGDTVCFEAAGFSSYAVVATNSNLPEDAVWANEVLYLTGKLPKNAVVDAYPVTVAIDGQRTVLAYNIKIYANKNQQAKGKTWQPADSKVQVHFFSRNYGGNDINVYHLTALDAEPEYVTTTWAEDNWVSFEAGSFSIYAATKALEKTITASDGNVYKITATYDDYAGIPDGAELIVSEVPQDENYGEYLNRTAQTLGVDVSELVYSKFFDIGIEKNGIEVKPMTQIEVEVELLETDAQSVSDLHVVHFGQKTEELAAQTEGSAVTFETGSFSVFGFADLTLFDRVVDAILGERTGTLYENDHIVLTGKMPALGVVEATPVDVEVNGKPALVAYDIKIYANPLMKLFNIAWQPTEGAIQVTVKSDAFQGKTGALSVYHMADADAEAELVGSVEVKDSSVTFDASSFSIYEIVDGDPPRRTYSFYSLVKEGDSFVYRPYYFKTDEGTETFQQIIKNGESLTVPELPAIAESSSSTFAGWYVFYPNAGVTIGDDNYPKPDSNGSTNGTLSGVAFDFNNIPTVTTDGEEVILCARFASFLYAIFHEQYNGSTRSWPVLATRRGEINANSAEIQISDLKVSYDDSISNDPSDPNPVALQKAFRGWSFEQQSDSNPNPAVISDEYITITDNVELYPVFVTINWLTFQSGPVGSGATYCAPVFYYKDSGATRFPIPVRTGYTFAGWWTEESGGVRLDTDTVVTETTEGGGTVFYHTLNTSANLAGSADFEIVDGQLRLKQDTTIYAHWTEAPTKYSIVIWRQSVNDEANLADDQKSYDFAESFAINSTTGASVSVAQSYKTYAGSGDYEGFHYSRCDGSKTVKSDGTTVLNVYYDRNVHTLTFIDNYITYVYGNTTYSDAAIGDEVTAQNTITNIENNKKTISGVEVSSVNNNYYYIKLGEKWYQISSNGRYVWDARSITSPLIKLITGLYGAEVRDNFPIVGNNGTTYTNERWAPQDDPVWQKVMVYVDTMPDRNVVFKKDTANYGVKTMNYWVEALPGVQNTQAYGGKQFTLYKQLKPRYNGVTVEDYVEIAGYDKFAVNPSTTNSNGFYSYGNTAATTVDFYYTLKTYSITFTDSFTNQRVIVNGSAVDPVDVKYTQSIASSIPADPSPVELDGRSREGYSFNGWYVDSACATRVFFEDNDAYRNYTRSKILYSQMPANNLRLFAGWATTWYRIEIDPNYGELQGTQSTFFWEPYNGDPILEYETVTRNYVPSINGTWYYWKLDRDHYGLGDEWESREDNISERGAGYTQDIRHDGVDLSVKYEQQNDAYRYANWYEVHPDGSETLYKFGEPVNHDTVLRLHWKQVGTYYLRYDAGAGTLDAGDSNEDTFKVLDSADYVDQAYVVVNRTAHAPEGTNFIGWRVRRGGSTIYYPGQGLEFDARYAVTEVGSDGVERKYMTLEAVYSQLETADIIYEANGGYILADSVDYGKSYAAEQPGGLQTSTEMTATRATLKGVQNNTQIQLSNGSGFVNGNLVLKGWNTKRDGSGTHYELGADVYIDTAGDNILFAEWEVKVVFHLNNEYASWPAEWASDPGFTLRPRESFALSGETYVYTMTVNNSVQHPLPNPAQVTVNGENQQFHYWAATRYTGVGNPPDAYDFNTVVTGELHIYGYWAAPAQVPVHVVDASLETLVLHDDDWRTSAFCVVDGQKNFSSPADASVYAKIPPGYRFAFAAASTSMESIADRDRIDYLYYNNAGEAAVWVHYHDGRDEALASEREIYIVLYNDPVELPILYKLMSNEGILSELAGVSGMDGTPAQASLGLEGYDMTGAVYRPYANGTYRDPNISHYAFAVSVPLPADETQDRARYIRVLSEVSDSDSTRPNFHIRHTWRGYEYSVDGKALDDTTKAWTNCGYQIRLMVVYYKQFPINVRVHEITHGLQADDTRRFQYHVTITQTVTVYEQDWWGRDTGNYTVEPNENGRILFDNHPFDLAEGENQAYSVFYSNVNADRTYYRYARRETTQTITITQTEDPDFTTEFESQAVTGTRGPGSTDTNKYTYTLTTEANMPDQVVTFTNTRRQIEVELHVAAAVGDRLIREDQARGSDPDKYTLVIPFGEEAVLNPTTEDQVQLPTDASAFYEYHWLEDHVYGGLFYGGVDAGVLLPSGGVTKVSFEQVDGEDYYAAYVYQPGPGGALTKRLIDDSHGIYYGYFVRPTIVYVKENYDGSLTTIHPIRRDGSPVSINYRGAEIPVSQNAVLPLTYEGSPNNPIVTVAQTSGSYQVPPDLDDGIYERELEYDQLAIGPPGVTSIDEASLIFVDDKRIDLQFQMHGPLHYRLGEEDAWQTIAYNPVIYAIYREKGHNMTIRKIVDGPGADNTQIFYGVVISDLLTKSDYNVTVYDSNGENPEETTIGSVPGGRVIPASGGNPGQIIVPLKHGTWATLHALPTGLYAAEEWVDDVSIDSVSLKVFVEFEGRTGYYANIVRLSDSEHRGFTIASPGSAQTLYRVDCDLNLILTNTMSAPAPTGLDFSNSIRPYLYVLLLSSALAILAATNRRRRRRDGYDDSHTGKKYEAHASAYRTDETGPPGGLDPPETALIAGPRARGDETLLSGTPPEKKLRGMQTRPCAARVRREAKWPGLVPGPNRRKLLLETILARARGDPEWADHGPPGKSPWCGKEPDFASGPGWASALRWEGG